MKGYGGRWFYDLSSTIARARGENGETEPGQARALLQYFCRCVDADSIPDARVMHYLSVALTEFLSQGQKGDIAKSLGLKRRRAGNPGRSESRHKQSTRLTNDAAEELRQEVTKRISSSVKDSEIKGELSKVFGISQDTVRDMVRKVKRKDTVGE